MAGEHGRRALVVRGGWEGHSPVQATELFVPFLEKHGFEVHRADSPAPYADAVGPAPVVNLPRPDYDPV